MRTLDRIRPDLDADLYDQLLTRAPDRHLVSASYGPPYREYVEWDQHRDNDGFMALYELETDVAGCRKADQDTWYNQGPSSCELLATLATKNAMQPILAGYGLDIRSIDHPQDDILLRAQTITVQYPSPEKFVANSQRIEADQHRTYNPPVRFEVFNGDYYTADEAIGKFAADRTVLLADNFGNHDILVHAISWLCLRKESAVALQRIAQDARDIESLPERNLQTSRLMSQLDTIINPLFVARIYGGQAFYGEDLAALTGEDEHSLQQKLTEHMNAPGTISLTA